MFREQVIEQLGLLLADQLHPLQPLVDNFPLVSLQVARGGHAFTVDEEISHVLQQLGLHFFRIHRIAALDFAQLGSTKYAVLAVLTPGQHAADHVSAHRHDRERGRHIGHATVTPFLDRIDQIGSSFSMLVLAVIPPTTKPVTPCSSGLVLVNIVLYTRGQFGAGTVRSLPYAPFLITVARFGSSPLIRRGRRMSNSMPLTPTTTTRGLGLVL